MADVYSSREFRHFDGKRYRLIALKVTRNQANVLRKKYRSQGCRVRVIGQKDVYNLYIRLR